MRTKTTTSEREIEREAEIHSESIMPFWAGGSKDRVAMGLALSLHETHLCPIAIYWIARG